MSMDRLASGGEGVKHMLWCVRGDGKAPSLSTGLYLCGLSALNRS
jgi:hypothetical protein